MTTHQQKGKLSVNNIKKGIRGDIVVDLLAILRPESWKRMSANAQMLRLPERRDAGDK